MNEKLNLEIVKFWVEITIITIDRNKTSFKQGHYIGDVHNYSYNVYIIYSVSLYYTVYLYA